MENKHINGYLVVWKIDTRRGEGWDFYSPEEYQKQVIDNDVLVFKIEGDNMWRKTDWQKVN